MKSLIEKSNSYSKCFAVVTLALLFLLTVLDALLSQAFLLFIPGVFEISALLLSLLVFFGVASAHASYGQYYAGILYRALPRAGKRAVSLICSFLYLGIVLIMTGCILYFAITQMSSADHTMALRVPLWIISMFGAIGMAIYVMSIAGGLISIIKDRGGGGA